MLRCTQCGSEDEFEVDEVIHRLIVIRDSEEYSYEEMETLEIYNVDWSDVRCCACAHRMQAYEAQDAYGAQRADTPIPYTLVDASTT